MRYRRLGIITIAVAAGSILFAGCGDSGSSQSGTASSSTTVSSAQKHNAADETFVRGMIPHHQQAVQMSDLMLAKPDIDPRVVDLAKRIKAAQGPEIDTMNRWLAEWSTGAAASPAATSTPGSDMSGHDMPGMSMPATSVSGAAPAMGHGMVSEEGMADLRAAQGTAASRLFLTEMIQHHRGAIMMAQNEIDSGEYPAAVALARSIVTTQQAEITEMEKLLGSL